MCIRDRTTLPVYADEVLRRGHYVAGANKPDHHRTGVSLEMVPQATFCDLRKARAGDSCPQCLGDLEGARVIEVGNIFQLGTKYSEPMGATFLDEDGKEQPIVMGSYGIGLARVAAAAIEQHHDGNGIVWPPSIAPFDVHLVLVRASDEVQAAVAEQLYAEVAAAGFEVLFDDRDMSPGIKFKDADLLGCPAQVVVGKRAPEGLVELKDRASGELSDGHVAPLARSAVLELHESLGGPLPHHHLRRAAEQVGVLELDARAHVAVVEEDFKAGRGHLRVELLRQRGLHPLRGAYQYEVQAALAEQLYAEVAAAGFEVLFDDRDMSPGIKFKDADLLGCPAQVVVGKRAPEGLVELKDRASGERRDVPVAELAAALRDLLGRG